MMIMQKVLIIGLTIWNIVSETFSDRKFYLKHKLSTASLQSSTGKVIYKVISLYLSKTADWQSKACASNKIYDQRTFQKLYYESWSRI